VRHDGRSARARSSRSSTSPRPTGSSGTRRAGRSTISGAPAIAFALAYAVPTAIGWTYLANCGRRSNRPALTQTARTLAAALPLLTVVQAVVLHVFWLDGGTHAWVMGPRPLVGEPMTLALVPASLATDPYVDATMIFWMLVAATTLATVVVAARFSALFFRAARR
jgi:hypothetical protein